MEVGGDSPEDLEATSPEAGGYGQGDCARKWMTRAVMAKMTQVTRTGEENLGDRGMKMELTSDSTRVNAVGEWQGWLRLATTLGIGLGI